MSVVLRKHWTAVERGFAERYGILDIPSTFNGRPLGYRKFETLVAPLVVALTAPTEYVENRRAAMAAPSVETSNYGDWRSQLPIPLPKPDSVVTLDQFVASGG